MFISLGNLLGLRLEQKTGRKGENETLLGERVEDKKKASREEKIARGGGTEGIPGVTRVPLQGPLEKSCAPNALSPFTLCGFD